MCRPKPWQHLPLPSPDDRGQSGHTPDFATLEGPNGRKLTAAERESVVPGSTKQVPDANNGTFEIEYKGKTDRGRALTEYRRIYGEDLPNGGAGYDLNHVRITRIPPDVGGSVHVYTEVQFVRKDVYEAIRHYGADSLAGQIRTK